MKKLICAVIALIIILSAFSAVSFAAQTPKLVTVKSTQNLFADVSGYVAPGSDFTIQLDLKTPHPIIDGTLFTKSDPEQIKVGSYSAKNSLPDAIFNPKADGKSKLVFGNGTRLLETTAGGEFVTFKCKATDALSSDQVINVEFELLRGSRYKENDYGDKIVDVTFDEVYIATSEVKLTNFTVSASLSGTTDVPPETQSSTETRTQNPTETQTPTQTTTESGTSGGDKKLLYGDSDLNNIINIKDATLIQMHTAKLATLTGDALTVSDVDGSGIVNVKDATCIQKYLAKLNGYEKTGTKVN